MSENIEERLQHLRSQNQEANRRYAQAEAKMDEVRSRREKVLADLKERGFSSPEEARVRAEALSEEVEQVLQQIEDKVTGL